MTETLVIEYLEISGEWSVPAPGSEFMVGDFLDDEAAASHVTFESVDGDYRASIPLDVARRQGRLKVQPDGSVRLRVQDGETLCWNVKNVGTIRLTLGPEPDSVPDKPSH